jgi:hypothetical protein
MAGHVFKDTASCPVPGTTNEKHENNSDRIASLCAEFFNPKPQEYEAEVLTTQSPCSVK